MDRTLTIFVYIWVGAFVLANLVGIFGQFYLHGFSAGFSYIQEVYSPFNIINYIAAAVTLSPAIGAYYWREKRKQKHTLTKRPDERA